MTIKAYGTHVSDLPLESIDITRRTPDAHVVAFTTSESKREAARALVGAPATPHPSPHVSA